MNKYQNLFIQTVGRSLQTALDSLNQESALPNDLRDRALTALDLAFKPQLATASWLQASELLLTISPKMEQAGYWQDWQSYLHQALTISQTTQDLQVEAAIGIQIGILQQRQGQFDDAKIWFETSIERAKKADDNSTWAAAVNRLGFVASLQNRAPEAVAYAEQALELLSEDDPQREYSYMVLGNVALNRQEPEKAADYYRQSIAICQEQGDQRRTAICLNNLGIALHLQGDQQTALDIYEKAVRIWQTINDPVELAVTKMNQGVVYEKLAELQTALRYYREAKPILEKVQNSGNLAKLYNNQAYCYYKLQRWQEAEEMYQASLKEYEPLENWLDYAHAMHGLGEVYVAQDQLEQAIKTFEDALQILTNVSGQHLKEHLQQEITKHLPRLYATSQPID